MTKRSLTILMATVVVVGFLAAAIASSIGGGSEPATHVMPGGQTMHDEQMTPPREQGPGATHEMEDGSSMHGEDMGMDR